MALHWRSLTSSFWALPALCTVTALVLGLALPQVDQRISGDIPTLFSGGPEGARSLLSAITTSMISVTGVVFSITVVVLQLASSQFSPRVLRTFLRSRTTQLTLGVFTATFLYAIVVLRAVRGGVGVQPFVPQIAVAGAFILVLASVALFLRYIQHITQSIRVATIVANVGAETRDLIERMITERDNSDAVPEPPTTGPIRHLTSPRPGTVVVLDIGRLIKEAQRCDVVFRMLVAVGDYAPAGMPLIAVTGRNGGEVDERRVLAAVHLGSERDMEQDIAFGFRQLVDIAERAISPAVNDPTTALQALNEIHDLLRRLVGAPEAPATRLDEHGVVRLVLREKSFADYLDLGVDEIAHYGSDSLRVRARVTNMLDDLSTASRPEYLPHLHAKKAQLAVSTTG